MENATKALLIAAAVLVAILIISLGLVVYNMASETIGAVNFSGQEIEAFNSQFTNYQGTHVRGTEVNAMLRTVLSSNMKSTSEGLKASDNVKFVAVKNGTTDVLKKDDVSIDPAKMANPAKTYTVKVSMDSTTGFVTTITFTDSTTTTPTTPTTPTT